MKDSRSTQRRVSQGLYHPLLGTNVEIKVVADAADAAAAQTAAEEAERRALDEMERLQAVFTVFDPDSELCRWRSGRVEEASVELTEVLEAAQHWWAVSGGAFHPGAAQLRARWLRAEAEQRLPAATELDVLAERLRELPYHCAAGIVVRTGDCSGLDLNAIAKGYIVDRGVAAAGAVAGVVDVLVNAGGDLRHAGVTPIRVGVEDPRSPGGRPIKLIELRDGAIATSGPVHRGFRIGDEWFGHVLDPRTGHPVSDRPSTTVRADDAMTADALATVVGVLDWAEASAVLMHLSGIGALAVLPSGEVRSLGLP
ncbi:FAD:protein FMN transferase [Tessaracoccus lacteus]|uniref:FAD:protein FMN transferase n=1 Tax=Tessaracoccus lacteus TaxID=3041766 RepID=A0ABY8Q264_9ACTN|nr:FAD:protein FMN transferase [Tessaracoccus sp. T21]WGT48468.1 FAD:protein FMN transferase [Tessaracoccus sp. T21]